tara:strand:+ start:341 stop:622 length:282 start_codon:yes stop_codon:yes gene_type:complete
MYYSKSERLVIVLEIFKNLKNYKQKNGNTINLYNEKLCSFIKEFKEITKKYINQKEDDIKEYKGILIFEEINKKIEYILPIKKNKEALFVIRM